MREGGSDEHSGKRTGRDKDHEEKRIMKRRRKQRMKKKKRKTKNYRYLKRNYMQYTVNKIYSFYSKSWFK